MPPKLRPLKKQISLTSQPPQHPYENDPNHRTFLSRSLTKSDVEISALIKLNHSLNEMKDYIVNEFGMDVLLDIGEGLIVVEENDNDASNDTSKVKSSDNNDSNNGTNESSDDWQEKEVLAFKHKNAATVTASVSVTKNDLDVPDSGALDETAMDLDDTNEEKNKDDTLTEEKNQNNDANETCNEQKEDVNNNNQPEDLQDEEQEQPQQTLQPSQQSKNTTAVNIQSTIPPPQYAHLLSTNPHFKPIVKNFILHLKLRRKLLNRLSRRLLRLSYAMDGKLHKINPPMLPKYGTSFEKHFDRNNMLKNRVSKWESDLDEKESLLEKLWKKKEDLSKSLIVNNQSVVDEVAKVEETEQQPAKDIGEDKKDEKNEIEQDKEVVSPVTNEASKTGKEEEEENAMNTNGGNEQNEQKTQEVSTLSPVKKETTDAMNIDTTTEQPMEDEAAATNKMDIDSNNDAIENQESEKPEELQIVVQSGENNGKDRSPEETKSELTLAPENIVSSSTTNIENTTTESHVANTTSDNQTLSTPFSNNPFIFDPEHVKDMEKLIQYDTDYSKNITIHLPSSTVIKCKTALTNEELDALNKDEDDFDDTNTSSRHGIGAVSKFMTKKEKVMEWKRWQAEFLSKIPDQPTFKELGMENRVFLLEERRKLAKECSPKKSEKKDEEMTGEEDKEAAAVEDSKKRAREEDHKENDNGNDKEGSSNKRQDKDIEPPIMKRKRISLDPVPSFFQQDYSRILMIQNATLSAAVVTNLRETYAQAKSEYDKIFQCSQDLQSKKIACENQLAKAAYDFRVKVSSINNNIAVAKHQWETEKKAFEDQKLQNLQYQARMIGRNASPALLEAASMSDNRLVKRSMDGVVDRVVIRNAPENSATGSQVTSVRLHHASNDSVQREVTTSMAHCIDTVVNRIQSGYIPDAIIDKGKGGEQFRQFIPPASTHPDHVVINASGETYTKIKKHLEAEISMIKTQLDTSEASRAKAWTRLNKAQTALNHLPGGSVPTTTTTSKVNRPKTSFTLAKRPQPQQTVPVYNPPPQRVQQPPAPVQQRARRPLFTPAPTASVPMVNNTAIASAAAAVAAVKANMNYGHITMSQQQASQIAQMSSQVVPTTTALLAPTTPGVTTAGSAAENKYSLEKVRARMFSDGSVLPVGMPKRGKDGLFLRPAGRQRKGMDWDAVNGKWVPQGSLPPHYMHG